MLPIVSYVQFYIVFEHIAYLSFHFEDAHLVLRQFLATESPLKAMKNAFVFHLESSFRF